MNLDVAVFPERNLTSFSLFTLIDLGLVLEITPSFLNLNSVLEATSLTVPAIDAEGQGQPRKRDVWRKHEAEPMYVANSEPAIWRWGEG